MQPPPLWLRVSSSPRHLSCSCRPSAPWNPPRDAPSPAPRRNAHPHCLLHQSRTRADLQKKTERQKERKSWAIRVFDNHDHAERSKKHLKDKSLNLPAGTAQLETCVTLVSTPGRWLAAVWNSRDSDEVSMCTSVSCNEFWPCPDKTVPHRQINKTQFLCICMAGCSLSLSSFRSERERERQVQNDEANPQNVQTREETLRSCQGESLHGRISLKKP